MGSRAPPKITRPGEQAQREVLIDWLWMEGSALPQAFAPNELEHIGLRSVGAIFGLPLARFLPKEPETT